LHKLEKVLLVVLVFSIWGRYSFTWLTRRKNADGLTEENAGRHFPDFFIEVFSAMNTAEYDRAQQHFSRLRNFKNINVTYCRHSSNLTCKPANLIMHHAERQLKENAFVDCGWSLPVSPITRVLAATMESIMLLILCFPAANGVENGRTQQR
jgi:hypothetical protein